jgi:hypothetical protein
MPDSVAAMIAAAPQKNPAAPPRGNVPNEKESLRETLATVLLISGCQDNQLSRDGARNGLFTETLVQQWKAGGGNIRDYRDFHQRVLRSMPPYQSPNYFVFGGENHDFELQKPFTI